MRISKTVALLALSLFFLVGCGKSEVSPVVNTTVKSSNTATTTNSSNSLTNPSVSTSKYSAPGILPAEQIQNKQIRIKTAKGDIVFELYPDTAPITVSNFVYLTQQKYYDGLTFHRREEGFVIQGGDPLGNGTGGPGYTIEEELNDNYTYQHGTVAMAKTRAPHSTGSQFFIMLADVSLDKSYTIFGKVIEGLDIVDQIKIGDVMTEVVVEDKK
ncbi:MAG: peptidylprolyl isomerase [Candidatus Uhrbacteria bacterium]